MTFETIDLFALAPSAGPGADRIDRYWSLVEKCLHKNPNLTLDSSDYASLLQRMLGNFEAYPLVNAYAPGGEEWRTCVESKALHRAIARLINLRPSGTAGGKPFNYKFLVPPDFSDLDNLFQLLAKREGIGDGFYLVSGPRGSGKSQLLRDMERKLKTHHTHFSHPNNV